MDPPGRKPPVPGGKEQPVHSFHNVLKIEKLGRIRHGHVRDFGHARVQPHGSVNAILAASEEAVAVAEATVGVVDHAPTTTTTTTHKPPTAPGVAKILKFAVPAIGVWLCSPLLSLIDTSAVGILSGTVQQAALNYAALLIAFMYTGATNLIAVGAGTRRRRRRSGRRRPARRNQPHPDWRAAAVHLRRTRTGHRAPGGGPAPAACHHWQRRHFAGRL